MNIISFLANHWHDTVVVAILGISAWRWFPKFGGLSTSEKVAYVRRILENLAPVAFGLVTEAENQFGAGTGDLKRAYVIDQIYERIPDEFKPFVTEQNLNGVLETALGKAKTAWEKTDRFKDLAVFKFGNR